VFDSAIIGFDKALRTLFAPATTSRQIPGFGSVEALLSSQEKVHIGALMRVNHVGEVCAQALYQGQSMACRDRAVRQALVQAAFEETEHLAWTERRIVELGGRKSLLNPLWYFGAFSFGFFWGRLGEAWSLGFLAETERQVERHLAYHLSILPLHDLKSRAIVQQMIVDESVHADMAVSLGARDLPVFAVRMMKLTAGVMTRTAYYV